MKYLLGKTIVAGRQFTYNDVTEKIGTGFGQDFYGGNVQYFGKTQEGFLLCIRKNKAEIMDIYVDEDLLATEGLKLLLKDQGKEEIPFEPAEESPEEEKPIDRKALIAKAKELGIEGKLATMKTEVLQKLIKQHS